ncbi:MAG: hypothetical protein IKE43_11630 [Coriobacteriales bacterium]|nr:hypothetical protein [Coriobacteriales bacterium]
MCTNGVNTGQFDDMIKQIDEHIALERRWTHNLGHKAEDAGFAECGEALHKAMSALDEARSYLDEARQLLESEAENASAVTVSLA